jgi:alanyl aminopeptidase
MSRVYSNTPADKETTERDGTKTVRFRETAPLPPYLVAFAIGPWEIVDLGTAGLKKTQLRLLVPKSEAAFTTWAREVTPKIFERLEAYFGIAYPYEKLDQVALPATAGLAMENAGLVAYDISYMCIRDRDLSMQRKRQSAEAIAHELAHQWFGNLVTARWWNDVWLHEGFAQWLQTGITDDVFPEWRQQARATSSLQFAIELDSLDSARRIAHPVESNADIKEVFDGITYEKTAAVLRMFETWIGAEKFRSTVRAYLDAFAHRNASASEFIVKLSSVGGKHVASAFSSFLYQTGAPVLTIALDCRQGAKPLVHVAQARAVPLGSKALRNESGKFRYASAFRTAAHAAGSARSCESRELQSHFNRLKAARRGSQQTREVPDTTVYATPRTCMTRSSHSSTS